MAKFIKNLEYTKSEEIKQDGGWNRLYMIFAIILVITQWSVNIFAWIVYVFENYI